MTNFGLKFLFKSKVIGAPKNKKTDILRPKMVYFNSKTLKLIKKERFLYKNAHFY